MSDSENVAPDSPEFKPDPFEDPVDTELHGYREMAVQLLGNLFGMVRECERRGYTVEERARFLNTSLGTADLDVVQGVILRLSNLLAETWTQPRRQVVEDTLARYRSLHSDMMAARGMVAP